MFFKIYSNKFIYNSINNYLDISHYKSDDNSTFLNLKSYHFLVNIISYNNPYNKNPLTLYFNCYISIHVKVNLLV